MPGFSFIHSLANAFFFRLRRFIRFRRPGYKEDGTQVPPLNAAAKEIDQRYAFTEIRKKLSATTGAKALASFVFLEQMFPNEEWSKDLTVVEPGCQGFSRLPTWRAYFKKHNVKALITGVELDPFVVLNTFHSRWDHAHYYISLEKDDTKYEAADFFSWKGQADLILCFYPFVSKNPALAWGLPARFASAENWLKSFDRVLKTGGQVLVVHQGDWEEKDFDRTRTLLSTNLELKKRAVLHCSFFETKYPAHASVYVKK